MDDSLRYLIVFAGVGFILLRYVQSPIVMTMYIVVGQKLIDILWFVNVPVLGQKLSVQRVVYTVLPVLIVLVVGSRPSPVPFRMPLAGLIITFLLYFTAAQIGSPYPGDTFQMYLKVVSPFALFMAGWYYFQREEQFDQFARLHALTFVIPFIGLVLQILGIFRLGDIGVGQMTLADVGLEEQVYRYSGFYNDPNTMAIPLYSIIPICFYFLSNPTVKNKTPFYAVLGMALTVVVFGFTRGLTIGIAVIVVAWLVLDRRHGWLGLTLAIAMPLFLFTEFSQNFFADIFTIFRTGDLFAASMSGRNVIWSDLLDGFNNRTSLLYQLIGQGHLAHWQTSKNYRMGSILPGAAHSDFFEYLYDMGYIGLGIYLLLIVSMGLLVAKHISACRRNGYSRVLTQKYIVWAALFAYYLYGVIGWSSRWTSLTWPLWFMAGFAFKHPAYYAIQAQLKAAEEAEAGNTLIEISPKLALR